MSKELQNNRNHRTQSTEYEGMVDQRKQPKEKKIRYTDTHKWCSDCDDYQPHSEFYKNVGKTGKDDLQYFCKLHTRKRVTVRNKVKYREFVEWLWALKDNPCRQCGGSFHPVVMQFDHVRGKKVFEVNLQACTRSKEKVLKELKKCELVCANCHALRTWNKKKKSRSKWRQNGKNT